MKNNIKYLLEEKGISVNKLADDLGMYYKTAHQLVNRKDLSDTKIGTLQKVAEYLEVDIKELYK